MLYLQKCNKSLKAIYFIDYMTLIQVNKRRKVRRTTKFEIYIIKDGEVNENYDINNRLFTKRSPISSYNL